MSLLQGPSASGRSWLSSNVKENTLGGKFTMQKQTSVSYINTETVEDVLVITFLTEDLRDANRCLAIREQISQLLTLRTPERVLLDMNRVKFIGSVGVRILVTALRLVCESQGRIAVCGLHGELRGLLYVCSLISDDSNKPGPFEVASDRNSGILLLAPSPH